MAVSIKSQIKKLAKEFDLKYNPSWFRFIWVSSRENILIEFITGCPDPIYANYGKKPAERIRNMPRFIASIEFKKCLKRYGGQIVSKEVLDKRTIGKIQERATRKELLGVYSRARLGKYKRVALLTKAKNKKQLYFLLKDILRHEWIHILLSRNNISFQSLNKKHWAYDEGLVEFMASFLDKDLDNLEKHMANEKYPMERKYWEYAIKFRKMLKGKIMPKDRKRTISRFKATSITG